MEVASITKKTELGIFPKDWHVLSINELSIKVGSGITPTGGSRVYKDYGRMFIRSQNVGWGKLLLEDVVYIDDSTHYTFANTEICEKDVLLNITGASIGRSAVSDSRIVGGNVNQHVCIIRTNEDKIDPEFLHMYLLSDSGQGQIKNFQAGGNRQGLNFKQVRSILVPVPSAKSEQNAIAKVISDVDSLLEKLDQLIVKKQNIKQAVAHQLLTGQIRLSGFSNKWDSKQLAELLDYEQPTKYLVNSSSYNNMFDTPVLTAGKTFYLGYTNEKNGIYKNLPAIIFDDFTTVSKYVNFEFKVKSSAMKILTPKNKSLNLEFIFQLMQMLTFKVGEHKRHWISEYSKIKVNIPDKTEQDAISKVLSNMQSEINLFIKKRTKVCDLKLSLMQELLKGKTRLKMSDKLNA